MIDRPHHVDLDYLTTHDLGRDVHETLSMEIFGDFFNVVLMNIALRALRSQEWWDSWSCIAVRVVTGGLLGGIAPAALRAAWDRDGSTLKPLRPPGPRP